MAFHQNGLTMTFFARDYTTQSVTGLDRIGFDVWNLVLLIISTSFGVGSPKDPMARIKKPHAAITIPIPILRGAEGSFFLLAK